MTEKTNGNEKPIPLSPFFQRGIKGDCTSYYLLLTCYSLCKAKAPLRRIMTLPYVLSHYYQFAGFPHQRSFDRVEVDTVG